MVVTVYQQFEGVPLNECSCGFHGMQGGARGDGRKGGTCFGISF